MGLIDAHERAVNGGLYADVRERFEAFSLAACDLLALPHDAAVLTTTARIQPEPKPTHQPKPTRHQP